MKNLTNEKLCELLSTDGINIYIAGKVTGDPLYKAKFDTVANRLITLGYNPLNPATYPAGLTQKAYMHLSFTLIDEADLVIFLPDWIESKGAKMEDAYCDYTDTPSILLAGFNRAIEYMCLEEPTDKASNMSNNIMLDFICSKSNCIGCELKKLIKSEDNKLSCLEWANENPLIFRRKAIKYIEEKYGNN